MINTNLHPVSFTLYPSPFSLTLTLVLTLALTLQAAFDAKVEERRKQADTANKAGDIADQLW